MFIWNMSFFKTTALGKIAVYAGVDVLYNFFSLTFLMSDIVVLTVNLFDLESVPETRVVMITMGEGG